MSRFSLLLTTLFLLQGTLPAQAPSEVEVLLAPGQAVGVQPLSFFRSTRSAVRNAAGDMLLLADYCRQPPEGGACQAATNLFLLDDQGIRPLITEQTLPPGLNLTTSATTIQLTDSGQILVAQIEGILRWEEGRLRWVVRRGDPAPDVSFQGTEVHFDQFHVSDRFGRDDGSVVFRATLTNQASGIFEAAGDSIRAILVEGESPPGTSFPIPGGVLTASGPVVAGPLVAFPIGLPGMQSLLLHDGSDLRTVAERGATLEGVVVESVGRFDLNANGQVAFEVYYRSAPEVLDTHLFLYQNGQLSSLTAARPLPGLPDLPIRGLTGPYVTDFGEIYFGVTQVLGSGGIFCWRGGRLTKIVADGDTIAGGRTLTVTFQEIGIPIPPIAPLPPQRIARPHSLGELAFQARVSNEAGGPRTLIWRAGDLEVLDLNLHLLAGDEKRIVDSVFPVDSDSAGRVLLQAGLCCGVLREALLLTGSARMSRLYLPYFVQGDFSPELSYETWLRTSNFGRHTALYGGTLIGDFPTPGPVPYPTWLHELRSGLVEELFFPGLRGTGFLRIDNFQGGPLTFYATIRLLRNRLLVGETALEAQNPLTDARLVVDSSAGDRVGIALSNPDYSPLTIDWEVIDDRANRMGDGVLELREHEQVAMFVDQLVAGLPKPFLGVLRLRSEEPFLAAGLRLHGLQLSTIPVETGAPLAPPYGFPLLVPNRLHPVFEDRVRQVLLGPADEQAVVTQDSQLHVITREGPRVLFGPEHPLVEARFSDVYPNAVRLVEFGPQGLLFFLSPGEGRPGLFLWDGTEVRRLIRNGQLLPDGTQVVMGVFPEEFAINRMGQIALGVNALFRREPTGVITPILSETDPIPGGGGLYTTIVSVDINDSGAIGFATARTVGRVDASGIRIVARVGERFALGFVANAFERVRITSDGKLYFTATGLDPLPPPGGLSSPLPISGLFYFDGEITHPMLRTGTAVTSDGRISVSQVAGFQQGPDTPSSIKLNHQDELAVFASLGGEPSIFAGGFFLLANTTAQPQVMAIDKVVDPASPLRINSLFYDFGWNDRGELLFTAYLPEFQDGLFVRRSGGELERIIVEGDRIDGGSENDPTAVSFLNRVWDLSPSGTAAFEAFTYPSDGSGTYLARPDGFHQIWVPHVVSGRFGELDFSSALLVHNLSPAAARVEVDVFSASGTRTIGLPEMVLEPGETRRLDLEFPTPMAGWARLQVRGGNVGAFLRLSLRNQQRLQSELTVPGVRATRRALWRARTQRDRRDDTGLAIVNTGNIEAEITIESLGGGGSALESRRLTLPPGGYRAILLSELFPVSDFGISDRLFRISSPNALALFSLGLSGGRISAVPLIQGSAAYGQGSP